MSVLIPNVFGPIQAIIEKVGHFSASRPNSRRQRNPQPVECIGMTNIRHTFLASAARRGAVLGASLATRPPAPVQTGREGTPPGCPTEAPPLPIDRCLAVKKIHRPPHRSGQYRERKPNPYLLSIHDRQIPDQISLGSLRWFTVVLYWALLLATVAVVAVNWRRDASQRTANPVGIFGMRLVAAGMWYLGTLWKLPLPVSEGFRFWLDSTVKHSSL
jgi:hypothetical protein